MKNVVFMHGSPDKWEYLLIKGLRLRYSRIHWAGWLGRQLVRNGFVVNAPEIPKAYDPQWDIWCKEAERFEIGPQTILIGHSCGGGFWLRYLSEHPKLKVDKVLLVAPWLDVQKKEFPDFFNFKIDKNLVARTAGLTVFYSDNDMESIKLSVEKIKKELKGVNYRKFHNYGHFTILEMKTNKFPELLEECLR